MSIYNRSGSLFVIWCNTLNPSLDVIYKIDGLCNGNTYLDCPCTQIPAGKGLNVARTIHALGEDVTVTGLLPEYDSRRVVAALRENGISHRFFAVPGSMRINVTLLDDKCGVDTHFTAASSKVPSRIQHEYIAFAAQQMKPGDFWCFSGSLPRGFPEETYAALICAGKEAGVKAVLDSRGGAFRQGVRSRPYILKPNLDELEEFFGEQIRGVHHIALKGKRLLDMGISYIFISLGADGMIALHANDCLLCSAPQVAVRNTVGCGDALLAGTIVAMKRKFSFSETCRMAVACGTAKAMLNGTGNISDDSVWHLMEEVHITSV